MMVYEERRGIPLEGRKRFLYRNFKGEKRQFNEEGKRNFCILLTEDEAEAMAADRWNVKWTKARDEDDEPQPYLKVNISYKYEPHPKIVLITNTKVVVTEDTVHILDYAEVENADLTITPYVYNESGSKSAYLKTMYVTLVRDEFEDKYSDIPFDDEDPPF